MATQGVNIIRLHQIYDCKPQKFPMNIHSNVLSVTHLIFVKPDVTMKAAMICYELCELSGGTYCFIQSILP